MTPERMKVLESKESDRLTPQEMRDGWHFCPDWDYMLTKFESHGGCECTTCEPWTEEQING
jgi:hypothetical protein